MTTPQPPSETSVALEFVRSLAGELSSGTVELPAFPEIATRVRRVVSDPNSTLEQVVRVVGSEPSLAARVVRISNSASFNRSGCIVGDLRTAINRIGYNMVRSVAIAFAISQIRGADNRAGLGRYLTSLWRESVTVAAFAYVLARTCAKVNPDEAMLSGMLHGIGKLYVVTHAAHHPVLRDDRSMLEGIIKDWHASIGKAIVENWEFSAAMAAAIGQQDDHARIGPTEADLSDVLCIAVLMAGQADDSTLLAAGLLGSPAAQRLGLSENRIRVVTEEGAVEVAALTDALGD